VHAVDDVASRIVARKARYLPVVSLPAIAVLMANCFRCGRQLPTTGWQFRRTVKTGEHVRRSYSKLKVSSPRPVRIRVVCSSCANVIDRQKHVEQMVMHLQVLGALIFLLDSCSPLLY